MWHTGDHIFGLVPLLTSLANGAGGIVDDVDPRAQSQEEHGISKPVDQLTSVCLTAIDHSLSKYTVHWALAHMSLLVSPLPTAP